MPLPTTILVPTDFGEPSRAALRYALDLAQTCRASVVLLHSYEVPIVGMPEGAMLAVSDLSSRLVDGAEIGLAKHLEEIGQTEVPVQRVIKQGPAHAMIHETVDEVGADLIVMGTHGRTGLPRMLLGSVAEKVVRTAHVPVLTIHPTDVTTRPRQAVPAMAHAGPSPSVMGANGIDGPISSQRH